MKIALFVIVIMAILYAFAVLLGHMADKSEAKEWRVQYLDDKAHGRTSVRMTKAEAQTYAEVYGGFVFHDPIEYEKY